MSMKNSNETIENQSRDLPAGSAVPEPTAPPRAPSFTPVKDTRYLRNGLLCTARWVMTQKSAVVIYFAAEAWNHARTRHPFFSRLDKDQGWSGRLRKFRHPPPPRFDPRPAQPVASHYINWAIVARTGYNYCIANTVNWISSALFHASFVPY